MSEAFFSMTLAPPGVPRHNINHSHHNQHEHSSSHSPSSLPFLQQHQGQGIGSHHLHGESIPKLLSSTITMNADSTANSSTTSPNSTLNSSSSSFPSPSQPPPCSGPSTTNGGKGREDGNESTDQTHLARLASVLLTFSSSTSTPLSSDSSPAFLSSEQSLNTNIVTGITPSPAPSHATTGISLSPVPENRLPLPDIPALMTHHNSGSTAIRRQERHLSASTLATITSTEPTSSPSAFAKLQGQSWEFYIQRLAIILGKSPELGASSTEGVDVFLGSSPGISRKHLRIEYNSGGRRWECYCFGKSGVRIDGRQYEPFCQPVILSTRSLIEVDDVSFYFLLPVRPAEGTNTTGTTATLTNISAATKKTRVKSKSIELTRSTSNTTTSKITAAGTSTMANDSSQLDESVPESAHTGAPPNTTELVKPALSYACLIAEAINNSPDRRLTLSSIYQYLADHYPYFRYTRSGWQNSIRHNLSLNKAFRKIPRGPGETGKGMFWTIDPQFAGLVEPPGKRLLVPTNATGTSTSSGVSSILAANTFRRSSVVSGNNIKESAGSAPTTPPLTRQGGGNTLTSTSNQATLFTVPAGLYVPILPTRPYSASPALLAPQLLEAAAAVEMEQQQQQHQAITITPASRQPLPPTQ